MVAIATIPSSTPARRPALRTVPPAGRGRRVGARRWSSSTVVAVLVALVAVVAVVSLARLAPLDGRAPVPAATHVVAEGETMWSIAQAHARPGEAAGFVERLVAVNGGARVEAGQVIALPGD